MDASQRRYVRRIAAFGGGYVAVNIAAIFGAFDDIGPAAAWVLALAVAAPVAGQRWALRALMRDSDEFVRAVEAKRFILASGGAIALFSAWGFGESYANAPHAPGWLVFPLFWAIYGAVSPFVRTSRV